MSDPDIAKAFARLAQAVDQGDGATVVQLASGIVGAFPATAFQAAGVDVDAVKSAIGALLQSPSLRDDFYALVKRMVLAGLRGSEARIAAALSPIASDAGAQRAREGLANAIQYVVATHAADSFVAKDAP